jgi:hypothetical protein
MTRPATLFALLLALCIAGCSAAKPSSAAPPSGPTAISAAAYQQLLSGIDAKLVKDKQLVSAALTSSSVSLAVTITADDVSGAVMRLSQVSAPASMKAGQADLVAALRAYGSALSSAARTVDADQICAGSAELAQISQSGGVARLRATALAAAVPQATADTEVRLANGTVISRAKKTGLGDLTIINTGGSTDAVVDLVLTGRVAALAVYVRAASSTTVKGVTDGDYQVYITTGSGWDPVHHLFTRACGFQKMDSPADFTTSTHGNTTQYVQDQITITPVVNGNVQVTKVPPAQFPRS